MKPRKSATQNLLSFQDSECCVAVTAVNGRTHNKCMYAMKPIGTLLSLSITLTLTLTPLAAVNSAHASGGYSSRMAVPHPTTNHGQVDREKYNLGQRVFAGKVNSEQGDATTQKVKLTALQSLLPAKVAKEKDLSTLAGKLSPAQLDALDYFLNQRYSKAK